MSEELRKKYPTYWDLAPAFEQLQRENKKLKEQLSKEKNVADKIFEENSYWNKLEEWLKETISYMQSIIDKSFGERKNKYEHHIKFYQYFLDKMQEIKGSDKGE